jgi:type IV pilus assembly protein PilA
MWEWMIVIQNKNKLMQSFSLVELMVVIAIIGILSAIAVPSYKNYIITSKFTELLSVGEKYKIEAAEAFNNTGNPPTNRVDMFNSALIIKMEFWQYNGIEFIHMYPQNFYPGYVSPQSVIFKGKMVNDILTWTCCYHPGLNMPGQYLPSACNNCCTEMNVSCP